MKQSWVLCFMVLLALGGCATAPGGNANKSSATADNLARAANQIAIELSQRIDKHPNIQDVPVVLALPTIAGTLERTVAELTLTSILSRGTPVAAVCQQRCIELSILTIDGLSVGEENSNAFSAGDLIQVASSANPILGTLTRIAAKSSGSGKPIKPAPAVWVTLSLRDGVNYLVREHFVALLEDNAGTPSAPAAAATAKP